MQHTALGVIGLLTVSLVMHASPVLAQDKPEGDKTVLSLFGTPLKGADRSQLRDTLKKNDLKAIREDDRYWVDTYNPQGVLDGASAFEAGYVSQTHEFAYARYTFKSFMDAQQVGKIVSMVTSKYGEPSTRNGNYSLGKVSVQWNFPQGMFIEVTRGWPDTTTYLAFIDAKNNARMESEIATETKRQESEKTSSQGHAF